MVDEEHHNYYPVVFFSEFWLLREHFIPLHETVDSLHKSLTLSDDELCWKYMMYNQMDETLCHAG